MKKLFTTMMLVAAVAVSGNVMAQNTKKETSDKPKTETCEKKSCCQDTKTAKKDAKATKTTSETKKETPTTSTAPAKK